MTLTKFWGSQAICLQNMTQWYGIISDFREQPFPARVSESVVLSSLGKGPNNVKNNDHLRQLWNEILDKQLTKLTSRFQEDQYGIMKVAVASCPQDGTFDSGSLQPPSQHYGVNTGNAELTVLIQYINRKVASRQQFALLMEVIDCCSLDIFPKVTKLLRIIVTLPMT